jgi:hypothetical protein
MSDILANFSRSQPPAPQDQPHVRHSWLYALPGAALPQHASCGPARLTLVETFKHDFFAATGLYRDQDDNLVVVKFGRVTPLFGLPLGWIGRFLRDREARIYQLVDDLPGVPRYLGPVEPNGFAHVFVPGGPLGRRDAVSDTFFSELSALVTTLHARDLAYVDLNKRQNILKGSDGRPYLIDFQISLHAAASPVTGRGGPLRWLLETCQRADIYHVLKHKRRLRPELLTEGERARVEQLSVWIRLHRLIARPLTQGRRRVLRWLVGGKAADVPGASAK